MMRTCLDAGTRCSSSSWTRSACRRTSRVSVQVRAAATPVPSQYKTVTPLGGRVLVKQEDVTVASTAGIIMPAAGSKKSNQGKVVSTSGETVKSGDKVIYGEYAGTDISISDTDHVLLKEEDIVGLMDSTSKIAKMSPLSDRILVEVAEADDKSSGGVLLTSATTEKPTLGKVLAVGPGRKEGDDGKAVPVDIKVGSTILYSKYSGTELEDEDKQLIIIRAADVLAELA